MADGLFEVRTDSKNTTFWLTAYFEVLTNFKNTTVLLKGYLEAQRCTPRRERCGLADGKSDLQTLLHTESTTVLLTEYVRYRVLLLTENTTVWLTRNPRDRRLLLTENTTVLRTKYLKCRGFAPHRKHHSFAYGNI